MYLLVCLSEFLTLNIYIMKLFYKILLHSFVFASIVACSDDSIGDASPSGDDSKSVCYLLNSGD